MMANLTTPLKKAVASIENARNELIDLWNELKIASNMLDNEDEEIRLETTIEMVAVAIKDLEMTMFELEKVKDLIEE